MELKNLTSRELKTIRRGINLLTQELLREQAQDTYRSIEAFEELESRITKTQKLHNKILRQIAEQTPPNAR